MKYTKFMKYQLATLLRKWFSRDIRVWSTTTITFRAFAICFSLSTVANLACLKRLTASALRRQQAVLSGPQPTNIFWEGNLLYYFWGGAKMFVTCCTWQLNLFNFRGYKDCLVPQSGWRFEHCPFIFGVLPIYFCTLLDTKILAFIWKKQYNRGGQT